MSLSPEVEFAHDQDDMVLHMPFLTRLAASSRVIVEIGAGHGNGSTRAFVRGLARIEGPRLMVSVDIDPERPHLKPQVPWWHVVHGDSRDAWTMSEVSELMQDLKPPYLVVRYADVIFIDTVHTPDYMERELQVWSPLANEQTVWCFHDTWMFGVHNGMNDAIYSYCQEHTWKFIDLTHESHGLGLMVHESNQREFVWP